MIVAKLKLSPRWIWTYLYWDWKSRLIHQFTVTFNLFDLRWIIFPAGYWLQLICTVSAGTAAAFVKSLLAVGAGEASRAVAVVPARVCLHAGSPVKTWPVCTSHGADLAVLPIETLRACTRIIVHQILERRRKERRLYHHRPGNSSDDSDEDELTRNTKQ